MEILVYETENGKCPVEEFLSCLAPKMYAKVLWTVNLLELNGTYLREPFSKPLGNGIFELRVQQGSNIVRILYFFSAQDKAVLTNGFTKKTQSTPAAQLRLAEKYRKDFERRNQHEDL